MRLAVIAFFFLSLLCLYPSYSLLIGRQSTRTVLSAHSSRDFALCASLKRFSPNKSSPSPPPPANANAIAPSPAVAAASARPPAKKKKKTLQGPRTITGQQIVHCRAFSLDAPKTFSFAGSFFTRREMPSLSVPDVAFVGRSNVGKSSLINCISGTTHKPLAVQSKLPGRTRAMNLFVCKDKLGEICTFVDLPGYGFAKLAKSLKSELSEAVTDFLQHRDQLKLIVVLIDPRRGPLESDYDMINMLVEEGLPFIIAATKADKLSKSELDKALHEISTSYGLDRKLFVPFSSITGQGKKDMWRIIQESILSKGIVYESLQDEEEPHVDLDSDLKDHSFMQGP